MKNIWVLSLAIVSILTVSADAKAFHRVAKTIASVQNVSEAVQSVSLDANGMLTVEARGTEHLVQKQLSSANIESLSSMAHLLSRAEITHHEQGIVCMMVPSPYQPLLQVSKQDANFAFTGVMRNVHSYHNCAIASWYAPKEEYAVKEAEKLKEALIVLANEYVDANE